MNLYQIASILGFSIVIAGVLGVVRYKIIDSMYYPFIFIVWLATVNHVLSLLMVRYFHSNAVNANVYVLLESAGYVFLFKNAGLFKRRSNTHFLLLILLLMVWVLDNIILHSITRPNAIFRIFSSFLLLILAVEQIVALLPRTGIPLFTHALFCICLGMIFYFTFKSCIEVFFLIQKDISVTLQVKLYALLVYLNFFVNLFFAWAILWIPRKKPYLLLR
ncbi:MAG: hypothetical protein KGZ74_12065 [Chitinophagaceae bacterium]|nr:hypothetical protein [Chitinophagaceae bacterium]